MSKADHEWHISLRTRVTALVVAVVMTIVLGQSGLDLSDELHVGP